METAVKLINDTGDFSLLMGIDLELYNNLMFAWSSKKTDPKRIHTLKKYQPLNQWQFYWASTVINDDSQFVFSAVETVNYSPGTV